MALRYPYGLRWQPMPLVVTLAMYLNIDICCINIMDSDLFLSYNLGQDITMVSNSSIGHPAILVSGVTMFLRHQHHSKKH